MSSAERFDKSIGIVMDGDGWECRWIVVDKRRDGLLICAHLYLQDLETGPKLPYTEALLSFTDDQGRSLFKYPRDVMLHIILTLETLLMNQCPLRYTATAVSITATAVIAAVFTVATAFTVIAAIVTAAAAAIVTAAATSIVAAAASSISASNRRPHPVNPFGTWTYYPKVPSP
jgi:hypothetical protein